MLVWRGPQFAAFRVPLPVGLPEVDGDLARMLRVLGEDPPTPALATITDAAERDALFLSLATTLTRTTYHRRRFEDLVAQLATRRVQVGGTVSSDTSSKFATFEAGALLAAARTVVDEVLYIAARRSGAGASDADAWSVNEALTCNLSKSPKYDVAEAAHLRARIGWYQEMNVYRNVLVHRGWREQHGGFFPVGSTVPEAADPARNALLMPDRSSLVRTHRAHQWTYNDGTRLELVVERASDGLEDFLMSVGRGSWGGSIPAPGTAPADRLPNMFVQLPHPGLVFAGAGYAPLFTSEERAREFHRASYESDADLDLFEVLPTMVNDGTSLPDPGFWLCLPSGKNISEPLRAAGLPTTGDAVIVLDPVLAPGGTLRGDELHRLPISDLIAAGNAGVLAKVPMDRVRGVVRLLLWRRRP